MSFREFINSTEDLGKILFLGEKVCTCGHFQPGKTAQNVAWTQCTACKGWKSDITRYKDRNKI